MISRLRHVPTYQKISDKVELVSVCDLDENLAISLAKDFNIPAWYKNVDDMLEKENLDIVDICVPPKVHSKIAISAMNHGCHTFIEKPMAMTSEECRDMIEVANKNNVSICINHNNLFNPAFIRAENMVKNGIIGDVIGMRIYLSTPRDEMLDLKDHWYHSLPGGMIGETGPHVAYMTQAFIKNINGVSIVATSILKRSWAPYDEFGIELEGSNGICSVGLSYSRDTWGASIELFGIDGTISFDLNTMLVTRKSLRNMKYMTIAKYSLGTIPQIISGFSRNVIGVASKKKMVGTETNIESFVRSINDKTPAPITGEMGMETVRVMEMLINEYSEKYNITLK